MTASESMTSQPMTREQLLEAAALDAFGLLDEYESALYTRSFHHAPAAVQDEITRFQAELASDESLHGEGEPDASLRERVLDAVARAIERESSQLAPLATIGRNRIAAGENPRRIGLTASGQFWRAAAFVLCGTVIVGAYFLTEVNRKNHEIARIALTNLTDEQLEGMIGPTVKDYMFERSIQCVLKPTNPSSPCKAVVYLQENSQQGFLVVEGLPLVSDPVYTLRVTDAGGAKRTVGNFAIHSRLAGLQLSLGHAAARLQNATWEIVSPSGVVLLASA